MENESFIRSLPKAELHVHIEGTLEPELMFALAARNDIALPFASVEDIRVAFRFSNLQSFLDIYYQGAQVLITEQDFYDMMMAYLERANADGVRRTEIFFDPQTHTERGIDFATFMNGFSSAIDDATTRWGLSVGLIMCFLRHLSPDDALATWHQSEPFRDQLLGIGLDSSEIGNPPELFSEPFRLAREAGLHVVAHAGEEGPPSFIAGAIDELHAERIDHGVRCEDDPALVERLAALQIPLTMCPLSNIKLKVFEDLSDHSLKRLLDQGVMVTINSDDPSYFGGYVLANYVAVAQALDLTRDDLITLARNSIEASFLDDAGKATLLAELATIAAA
ncbi:MAG: adenosine deaminase [Actinomycetia bacterium]|nr:adenosine deaminase [Actinomycetes bacterium]